MNTKVRGASDILDVHLPHKGCGRCGVGVGGGREGNDIGGRGLIEADACDLCTPRVGWAVDGIYEGE